MATSHYKPPRLGDPLTSGELRVLVRLLRGYYSGIVRSQEDRNRIHALRVKLGARGTAHLAWLAYKQQALQFFT